VCEDITLKIEDFRSSVSNKEIKQKLTSLKSNLEKEYVTGLKKEVSKCDFTLFREFLSKVKIFQSQTKEKFLKGLIENELQQACKAPLSVVNSIYTKFEEGFSMWWKRNRKIVWLNENSELWKTVEKDIITEINKISEYETQGIFGCGIRFSEQHVQKLSDAIKLNTVLNIVTNSSTSILQKLKIYQALNNLDYKNSILIGMKSLINKRKEINKFWPCKWCDVLVVDCDTDGNVVHTVLDILQQSDDCKKGLDISDDNAVEHLVDILQIYQQKVIFISRQIIASCLQGNLRNTSLFEDNCGFSELDEKSQKQILESLVKFQGTRIPLSTLVGTDPPENIRALLNSDVVSILLSKEHELSAGRKLDDIYKYYVPRVLQHQIYLKEDILRLTD
jgi:hypothetical protein